LPLIFNINDTVRVKLTDFGRQALQRQHVEFWASVGRAEPYPHTPPKEDAEGWSEWQLHSLMHELGHLSCLGGPLPFETEIEIVERKPWALPPAVPTRGLVERLRADAQGEDLGADGMGWSPDPALKREAADEIERLRAALSGELGPLPRAAERARLRGYFRDALADTTITWPEEVAILYDKCFGLPSEPEAARHWARKASS
jgi:hypothetical protein